MSPQQALQILDGLASRATGTREDHIQLQAAIVTLQNFVVDHSPISVKTKNPVADKKEKPNGDGVDTTK